jgi:hypothetical protein
LIQFTSNIKRHEIGGTKAVIRSDDLNPKETRKELEVGGKTRQRKRKMRENVKEKDDRGK